MRVQSLTLRNFKRFTDLRIVDIPPEARAVVLVGPNGCGKSSVFDAMEQLCVAKPGRTAEAWYLRKDQSRPIELELLDHAGRSFTDTGQAPKTLSYIRSSYRYSGAFNITAIQAQQPVEDDADRPKRLIDVDQRLPQNYQRLFTRTLSELYRGELDQLSGREIREKYVGTVNHVLAGLLDVQISDIGDPVAGRGQLYFQKGDVEHFPYANLSSGEKEVVDLVLDLVLKSSDFRDCVFCIDEPDLHISTAIQAKLVGQLIKLLPTDAQLWLATHSVGIVRAAIEHEDAVLFDFGAIDDFDSERVLSPITPNADALRSIFRVALEDLAELVVPSRLVLVEGETAKRDAAFYAGIFSSNDVEFLPATNKPATKLATARLVGIVERGLSPKLIRGLVDRDGLNDDEIEAHSTNTLRIIPRYSVENYALEPAVLAAICDRAWDEAEYVRFLTAQAQERVAALLEDIRESRRHDSVTSRAVDDHPLLRGDLELHERDWKTWLKLIPGRQLVGVVLEWIRGDQRSSRIDGQTSIDDLLMLAGEAIANIPEIREELAAAVIEDEE